MRFITKVKYLTGSKLEVTFDNCETRIVDLKDYFEGEIFEPLRDLDFFKKVSLNTDIDTIVWTNDADFSPDFLYEISQ